MWFNDIKGLQDKFNVVEKWQVQHLPGCRQQSIQQDNPQTPNE